MSSRSRSATLPLAWRLALAAAYAGALAVVVWFAWDGWSYYATPVVERPRLPEYWSLKPGGSRGHGLGVVGASLLVLMLVYSVRKRVRALSRLGPLRAWLHFHIFCGIVGTLLVVLHSSFKVRGLVALSFWSMIVVALSGVVGRYLYLQIPRTRAGDELTLEEARRLSAELAAEAAGPAGVDPALLDRLDRAARQDGEARLPLAVLLLRLPWSGLALRWRLRRSLRELPARPGSRLDELAAALRQRAFLERRLALWQRLHDLFHYWHVFHKPFAAVMYLFLILHVAVVVMTGYAWGS